MGALLELRTATDHYRAKNEEYFRSWHVESLLNQSADLLDRCMQQRQYLRLLEEKRIELNLRTALWVAEEALESERVQSRWFRRELTGLQETWNLLEPVPNLLGAARQHLADALTNTPVDQSAERSIRAAAHREADVEVDRATAEAVVRRGYLDRLGEEAPRIEKFIEARKNAYATWRAENFSNQGKLYVEDQISATLKSIKDDFADAYDRATAVSIGLRDIYGYATALPAHADTNDISLIDGTTLWVRAALRWLTAFNQYDQIFKLVFSLRRLGVDINSLCTSLNADRSSSVGFTLDHTGVDTHCHLRLRGISMLGVHQTGVLAGTLQLPQYAISRQISSGGAIVIKRLDQRQLPYCILGRIEDSMSSREPDVVGGNSLINVSPFGVDGPQGRCTLNVKKVSPVDVQMDDLLIEITVAGRPQ